MWKYNETNSLPSNELYHSADELYHYGVLGMRWHHRQMRRQQYNNDLVNRRRTQAKDNYNRLKKLGASDNKLYKAKLKADKIERSKYGQTRGQILGRGILRSIGASVVGGTAYKIAANHGMKKTKNIIAGLTSGYKLANAGKTVYKMVTNYDVPTKKSGTRMSYR